MISPFANICSFGLTFSENSAEVIDSFHPEHPASFFARGVTREYKETRRVRRSPRNFNLFAGLIVVAIELGPLKIFKISHCFQQEQKTPANW